MCLCGHTYASVQSERRLLHRPPWGPSREPRVRAAVKSQEQTRFCTAASELRVRFRSAAARPSSSVRVPWCLRRPSRSDSCPSLLFPHLSPAQDFYQTAEPSPVSGGKGGPPGGLRCALYELPVCSFCVPLVPLLGALSSRDPVLIGERSPAVPSEWGVHMGLHPRAALTCSLPLPCCPESLCRHVDSVCPSVKCG